MANEEHLAILKHGVATWNEWREKNPDVMPNLGEANLDDTELIEIDFSKANLKRAKLYKSELNWADLSYANLNGALLMGANLSGANLNAASLLSADLTGANLSKAHLVETNLRWANLSNVYLTSAFLFETYMSGTELSHADFSNAQLGWTAIIDVDLGTVKGLETVRHEAPSTVGIDTIYKSGGKIPEVFLRGAGVPENFITFMHSLTGDAIKFYSCFVSYSNKDQGFVEQLYADLKKNGVRCWYAPEDLKIGEPFLLGIEHGIRLYDKLLLVLSESSVNSGWVQQEVLSAMAKEQGKAPWVLFPIRLDDATMDSNVPWANMIRQSRHIGDFTNWKNHDSYRKAFDRLLRDLKEGE